MQYSLLVTAGPETRAATTALRAAEAVLARGHHIFRIFFYRQGVLLASRWPAVADGEHDICAAWRDFINAHKLDAVVCASAAMRRGVFDQGEAARLGLDGANLAPEFSLSGLGQWAEATAVSDRVLSFGG